MIVRREKIYSKKVSFYNETRRQTSYWLLGIIPLYIKNEILRRD